MSDTAYSNVEIFKATEIYISTHTGILIIYNYT